MLTLVEMGIVTVETMEVGIVVEVVTEVEVVTDVEVVTEVEVEETNSNSGMICLI